MKVYSVIPIARGVSKEILSYFGSDDIPLGALVSIPLRKKTAKAIVISSMEVEEVRGELRQSEFALRKIGAVKSPGFLSKGFLSAVHEISDYYAAPASTTLSTLLPKAVLEFSPKRKNIDEKTKAPVSQEKLLIQSDDDERFAHYKSLIREEFARGSSVFFCVPTIEDMRRIEESLTKGIENFTISLTSGLSKKEYAAAFKKIEEEEHPLLIIATAPFLSVAPAKTSLIIMERENSRAWRTQVRPYLDLRKFIEKFAMKSGIRLIAGDIMLSTEVIWRKKNDEVVEFAPLKFRSLSQARGSLVDMKSEFGKPKEDFKILSDELLSAIEDTRETNGHMYIYSARKGLSPSTVCGDCGQVVTCTRCGAPIVLYGGKGEENFFQCNRCGERRGAAERCVNCNSWKLTTLGIGLELVEEEIKKRFPHMPLFCIDKQSVKTPKRALEIVRRFEDTPGSILLGTEMALFYLSEKVDTCAVASIDSLFSIPDFRMNERVLYILLKMKMLSQKNFIIQTRNAGAKIFDYAIRGNLMDFYRDEIADRKKFLYSPFSVFVKITAEGKRSAVEPEINSMRVSFEKYKPHVFESFLPSQRGNFVMHLLLRVPPAEWPHKKIVEKLKGLPPYFTVKVDPESLL